MRKNKIFHLFPSTSIILVTVLVYGHILENDFLMSWDDGWMVFNDYTKHFSLENIKAILINFYRGQYSPLNQIIYSFLYYLGGANAFVFHLMSLLLHMGCALLVWFIMGYFTNRRVAWGVALLFAIHPLQVESVAWISASKILVYSFFYLVALRLYISYVKKGNIWYYLGVLVCFVFSFGGKEQAVTLPVCLLLFDGILKRNFKDRTLWLEKIPFFILAFFFAYITLLSHASRGVGLLAGQSVYPFYQRLAFGAYAYTEYIVKTLLPVNLLYLYPFPMRIGAELPFQFWIYPIGWVTVLIVFYKFWRKPVIFYGMLYYTILIALTIQIIPMARLAIVADRYIYLACPGLFFIIVYYVDKWIEKAGRWKFFLIGSVIFYCLILGCYTHYRTYAWESNESLRGKFWKLLEQRENMYKSDL